MSLMPKCGAGLGDAFVNFILYVHTSTDGAVKVREFVHDFQSLSSDTDGGFNVLFLWSRLILMVRPKLV